MHNSSFTTTIDNRYFEDYVPGSIRVTVMEARRSTSKPDRGIVRSFVEVMSQKREVVMSVQSVLLVLCRNGLPAK